MAETLLAGKTIGDREPLDSDEPFTYDFDDPYGPGNPYLSPRVNSSGLGHLPTRRTLDLFGGSAAFDGGAQGHHGCVETGGREELRNMHSERVGREDGFDLMRIKQENIQDDGM